MWNHLVMLIYFSRLFFLYILFLYSNISFCERNRDDIFYFLKMGLVFGIVSSGSSSLFDLLRYQTNQFIDHFFFKKNDHDLEVKNLINIINEKKELTKNNENKKYNDRSTNREIQKIQHIENNQNQDGNDYLYRYLTYSPVDTIPFEEVIIDEKLKTDLLYYAQCVFNQRDTEDIKIPSMLCLYGLPGMAKTEVIKGIAHKLNVPIIIFDPILLDSKAYQNVTPESVISYAEKNSPCIVHIKNIDRMDKNFIFGPFLKMLQYGFITDKNILFSFSCNNDYFIRDLWINKNKKVKFVVLHCPDFQQRKLIIEHLIKKYEFKINSTAIDIGYLASLFDRLTTKDIKIIFEKTVENKIISKINQFSSNNSLMVEEQKIVFNNKDFVDQYYDFIKNNSLLNKDNTLNQGLQRVESFLVEKTNIMFDDVIGLDHIKEKIKLVVGYLRDPSMYKKFGIRIPKGILFKGPPGCGKTLMVRALAGESNVSIIVVNGSDFIEKYVGEGAKRVRELFEMAKVWAPAIIFIDEIDAIGIRRTDSGDSGGREYSQTLNELLIQMDGFNKLDANIILIGSTNRDLEVFDDAILRRFEEKFNFRLPTRSERLAMLELYMKDTVITNDVNMNALAGRTSGFSGADIEYLVNEIKTIAMHRMMQNENLSKELIIEEKDITEAYGNFCFGYPVRNYTTLEKDLWSTSVHEIGHTLCMLYQQGYFIKQDDGKFSINDKFFYHYLNNDKNNIEGYDGGEDFLQVTILPRDTGDGTILGMASSISLYDVYKYSKDEMNKKIIISLAGMVAEELIFGNSFDGVSSDLRNASHIAKLMVNRFGMSDLLYSPNAFEIGYDKEREVVERILQENKIACTNFLTQMKELLVYLAKKLKDKKILSKREVLTEINNFYVDMIDGNV